MCCVCKHTHLTCRFLLGAKAAEMLDPALGQGWSVAGGTGLGASAEALCSQGALSAFTNLEGPAGGVPGGRTSCVLARPRAARCTEGPSGQCSCVARPGPQPCPLPSRLCAAVQLLLEVESSVLCLTLEAAVVNLTIPCGTPSHPALGSRAFPALGTRSCHCPVEPEGRGSPGSWPCPSRCLPLRPQCRFCLFVQ